MAAIANQVLSNYSTQDPEELELDQVLGESCLILERSAESLREGRMSEINNFHEKGVVKRWSREEANGGRQVQSEEQVGDQGVCEHEG